MASEASQKKINKIKTTVGPPLLSIKHSHKTPPLTNLGWGWGVRTLGPPSLNLHTQFHTEFPFPSLLHFCCTSEAKRHIGNTSSVICQSVCPSPFAFNGATCVPLSIAYSVISFITHTCIIYIVSVSQICFYHNHDYVMIDQAG